MRFNILLVSIFGYFKWGNFGDITTYRVIFWKGYKQSYQYLKKVRLTGLLSLLSSNTCIFVFICRLVLQNHSYLNTHKCCTFCIFQIVYCTWEAIVKFSFTGLNILKDNFILPRFDQLIIYIRVVRYWSGSVFRREDIF